jgi:hypothetical protein
LCHQLGERSWGRLVSVETNHEQPPRAGRLWKTGQRFQHRRLGQLQVVQDQRSRIAGSAAQKVDQRLTKGGGGPLPTEPHDIP